MNYSSIHPCMGSCNGVYMYPMCSYCQYPCNFKSNYYRANAPGLLASAELKGGPLAPSISGKVLFKEVPGGTEVCVEVTGLPEYKKAEGSSPQIGPHGFHIHQFGNCEVGDPNDPFKAAGEHWNPTNQPHGNHVSDFPVLFSNHGKAMMCFFTDKFKVQELSGKSVIIHQGPDDYKSQPAGNAGKRLACGVIYVHTLR